jgi:16S rRNA A1518/A1519 N6-dimethyltransferase RsmA/KsgA/DIM1 with predicted DNA glycosylase/AP lyase activity
MLPLLAAASFASVDVSFVPTKSAAARAALVWANVGPGDTLYELGCGDGRVAAEALELGASVVCVERDPELAAAAATHLLRAAGSRPERAKVNTTDLFEVDLSEATAACAQYSGRHGEATG